MRAFAALVLVLVACSDRPPPAKPTLVSETPPADATVVSTPQAKTVKYVVVASSRNSGTLDVTIAADGTVTTKLFVLQNGRGPRVDATQRFAKDGTLASFEAAGQHELGTKFQEKFSRTGETAR